MEKDLDNSMDAEEIQIWLNNDDFESYVFADGTYTLNAPLEVNRPNVTLRGESANGVILENTGSGTVGPTLAVINTAPYLSPNYSLSVSGTAGTNTIQVTNTTGLAEGDTIHLWQDNYTDGWEASLNLEWTNPTNDPLREVHAEIINISGSTLTLSVDLPYDFNAAHAEMKETNLFDGITIEDLHFRFASPTDLTIDDYSTGYPTGAGTWNNLPTIELNGVIGAILDDITIEQPKSQAFQFQRSYGIVGSNLTAAGTQSRAAGDGYHFNLQEVFASTFTNLVSEDYIEGGTNRGGGTPFAALFQL